MNKKKLFIPILAFVAFVLIPNPIMAQVANCNGPNGCAGLPYVAQHWGLTICTDFGNNSFLKPLTDVCNRQDVIIQQNDMVITQNHEILSNMTYQEQLQVYQLCISAMNPSAGSLPGNYLLAHGISCTLPKNTPSGYGPR